MNTIDASTGNSVDMWKCRKPDCLRKIHSAAFYCCQICYEADRGRYEIDTHSMPCDRRAAERGTYSVTEAAMQRQPGTRS